VPLPCLRLSLESSEYYNTFDVTEVSKCHIVSQCLISFNFSVGLFRPFFAFFDLFYVTVGHSVTHLTLVTLNVTNIIDDQICHRALLVTDFN
jgi:hypothetical protein